MSADQLVIGVLKLIAVTVGAALTAVIAVTTVAVFIGIRGGVWLACTPAGRSTARVIGQGLVLAAVLLAGLQVGATITA